MAELDEVLFAEESIVDSRCELEGERLAITVLTVGKPEEEAIVTRVREIARGYSVSFAARRLDRIERKAGGLSMAELDEVLFPEESIVDCRCELEGERLAITALTVGELDEEEIAARVREMAPGYSVSFSARQAQANDRVMYAGKRVIKLKVEMSAAAG